MATDDTSCARSALLLSFLFLASIFSAPGLFPTVNAENVTHFGNTGFPQSVNLTFPGEGYDTSSTLILGANSVVSASSLDVRGWQDAAGYSPTTIGIDVGNDGDLEWAFGGPGNGSFGHVDEFSNGWHSAGVNLSTGSNSTYSIRLPLNATVSSASLEISTLSELTLSGTDVEDAAMRKVSSWGNSTHLDCNYGSSSLIWVGKTEWVNWNIYRSVYWFNLTQLPAVTVLDANLSFWIEDGVNNANTGQTNTAQHTYSVHPLLRDWIEGMESGSPVQQGPGVTWNNAIDNVTGTDYAWASSGASGATDRGSAIANVTNSPANLEQTWMEFNSSGLTNLIQGWVNGTIANQGLLLVGDETTSKPDGSRLSIASSENSTHGPRLTIVFEGTDDVTGGLDIGNDGSNEWSHAGNLSNGTTTPDFSATLNALLANAVPTFTDTWGNQFVDIPLGVTGNATLVLGNVDVEYDWQPTVADSALTSEINQHLSGTTPDPTGNVTIPINVTSGSAGIVELSNLNINLGDRPPSVGSMTLPTETLVPNGDAEVIGIQVTSYQGLANISWLAMTPQLSSISNPPILVYSFDNASSWLIDANGFVANVSGNWQPLNSDTGLMEWELEVGWDWPEEQGVAWRGQVTTTDNLHTDRLSTLTTNHERRMEIVDFHLWDETAPSDGGPEIFEDDWVAGGDLLRASGVVHFLDESSSPQPGDIRVELENVSGNSTTDLSGAFSINSVAPNANYYDGFTVTAKIEGPFDSTPEGDGERLFNIDATDPGMMLNSPLGDRIIPSTQQLFNVSIADSIGIDEGTLRLRWWIEAAHDDGDGIPSIMEYASGPLQRQGDSEFYHATYDDTSNAQGQRVSLFIEGNDIAGNYIGTGPGFEQDLTDYVSLVPSPTSFTGATLQYHGAETLVPSHSTWLNITLNDQNELGDLEEIVVDLGSNKELTWTAANGFSSNDPEVQILEYTITSEVETIHLNLSFMFTPFVQIQGQNNDISIELTDSSGHQNIYMGIFWTLDANIQLADFSISLADDPLNTPLSEDDYVALNERLKISGHVRYASADLAPPANSYTVELEVPSDLPLVVNADSDGYFEGEVSAYSNGFYRINLFLNQAPGVVEDTPSSLRLQVDSDAPTLISFEPSFIPANATNIILQFSLQDIGVGLSNESWPMTCQIMRGFDSIGEALQSTAVQMIEGQVSRYQVNLSFQPMIASDNLDCWIDAKDRTGNAITGPGSTSTWALRVPIIETRPDIVATQVVLEPSNLQFGMETTVSITLENHGNQTTEPFFVTLEALEEEVGRVEARFLSGQSSTTISVSWVPDWDGELDLLIHVDVENSIDEINENNTLTLSLEIESTPEEGFFSLNVIGGIALLLMLGVAMFALAVIFMRGGRNEDEDDWDDEEEVEKEEREHRGYLSPEDYRES